MFKNRTRHTLVTGALLAGASLAVFYGCSENKSTTLEPQRTEGPLTSQKAFPGLDASLLDPSAPTPVPVAPPPGFWNSVVNVNGDDLRDVFIAYTALHQIKLYVGVNDREFQQIATISVVSPRDLTTGDLDGDGLLDVAAFSATGNTVSIFTNNGDNTFALAAVRTLPGNSTGMVVGDYDDDGVGDVYFGTSNPDQCWIILDANDGYGFKTLITPLTTRGGVELQVAAAGCGNEPDCDPHPGDGIQECLRAADCRAEKCGWAACVLYTDHWWQAPRYAGAILACASVHIIESALCLPTQLIPKGKLTAAAIKVVPAGNEGVKLQ